MSMTGHAFLGQCAQDLWLGWSAAACFAAGAAVAMARAAVAAVGNSTAAPSTATILITRRNRLKRRFLIWACLPQPTGKQ
jgi:hypothetical protein